MGKWDKGDYMNKVNWPEKKLKKGYNIEMCFSFPDEVEENWFMWCCGVVNRMKTRYDKLIKVDIKWNEQFVACGESEKMEEILNVFCEILAHRGKGCGGRTCKNTWVQLSKCNTSFYVFITITIFSDQRFFKFDNHAVVYEQEKYDWSEKLIMLLYQNAEQEWMKLLIKQYNLHETIIFLIKFTIFIDNTKWLDIGWSRYCPNMQHPILCMPIPLMHSWLDYWMVSNKGGGVFWWNSTIWTREMMI